MRAAYLVRSSPFPLHINNRRSLSPSIFGTLYEMRNFWQNVLRLQATRHKQAYADVVFSAAGTSLKSANSVLNILEKRSAFVGFRCNSRSNARSSNVALRTTLLNFFR